MTCFNVSRIIPSGTGFLEWWRNDREMAAGGTGAVFFTMATIATVSKRDFSNMGKVLFIGMVVILLAALANIFFQIPALSLAISSRRSDGFLLFSLRH